MEEEHKLNWLQGKCRDYPSIKELSARSGKWSFYIIKDLFCKQPHGLQCGLQASYDYGGYTIIFIGSLKECKDRAQYLVD